MNTPRHTFWKVMFTDTWITITAHVTAINADDATVLADNLIRDLYDIDVSTWSATADDTERPAGSYPQ